MLLLPNTASRQSRCLQWSLVAMATEVRLVAELKDYRRLVSRCPLPFEPSPLTFPVRHGTSVFTLYVGCHIDTENQLFILN
uniref:Uncharacterized protein n=1 Tax=Anguilla anguilla TaxID=7936 RepID=A0A0E9S7G2_ANGAN